MKQKVVRRSCPLVAVFKGTKYATLWIWFGPCFEYVPYEFRRRIFLTFWEDVVKRSRFWDRLLHCKWKGYGEAIRAEIEDFLQGRSGFILPFSVPGPCSSPAQQFSIGSVDMHLPAEKELVEEFLPKLLKLLEEEAQPQPGTYA